MYNKFRKILYLTTILSVLLMTAMPSYVVYADGGTDGDSPPEEPPVTEPAEPAVEEQAGPATEPAGEDGDPMNPPPGEEVPAEEPVSVPEILEQVPEETALAVVNEEGNLEPLASETAAEILIEGDPIWCPEGQTPTPGANGCTISHLGFDDLIGDLAGGTYSGNGVIWVASNYDNTEDVATIVFNGNNSNLGNLVDISVQGGWNGVSGSSSLDPSNPSVLDDRLRFRNWVGDVSISNLDIQNVAGGNSLQVNTDGDINLNNVSVSGGLVGDGASLNNCAPSSGVCTTSGNVTVSDSEFTNNAVHGLDIDSSGTVVIDGVIAENNGTDGINVNTFNEVGADVTIKNTTADNNTQDGIQAIDVGGNLTIKDTTASDNTQDGIQVDDTDGDVALKGVTASTNGSEGIVIDDSLGNVLVSNTTASGNDRENIEIDDTWGNVSLSHVTANDSVNHEGVDIHNTNGNLWLKDVTVDNNDREGIEIVNVDGSLSIYCSQATNNGQDGIHVEMDHDFVIKCSQSTDNGGDGVQIVTAPTAQLLSVTATGNGSQDLNYDSNITTVTEKKVDCNAKDKTGHGEKGPWTKLYCLPGEIKVALFDTYGDKVEFENLCGYEAGVFDPSSWIYPDTIPGGGEDYITSLQNKMLEEIPNLEPITEYGLPGILAQVLDELPFMLPENYSYASAFFTAVLDEGEYMDPLPEESGLTVRFRVPEWLDPGDALSILWWDGADWVDLGGEYSEDGYYFQVTTEETGVFVLATFEVEG